MYLGVLFTYYNVYAIGETEAEVKKRIVQGYKSTYPDKGSRQFSNPTFDKLNDYFSCQIHEIDPAKGYTHE